MMKPLSEFPRQRLRAVRAVLTDIDDTLTDAGRLPACAYKALEDLKQAGVIVIPVTGRPAGWCDLIARQWPVDGVVGENGAFSFRYSDADRKMYRTYARCAKQRASDWLKLDVIKEQILAEVPGVAVSADQPYRESDLAIDFCEDVPQVNQKEVAKIVSIFEDHGAVAKVSSIHVNGWFGNFDKLTMSRAFLKQDFDLSVENSNDHVIFVGDSPNDSPMFGYFTNSVGVANVRDFEATMPATPKWVTDSRGARGFVEIAQKILETR
jgi:HAD superfamily hydrolase (TIGR01484 family)